MCLWSVACRVRREGPARESRLGESNGVLNIMMPRYTRTYGNEMIGKIINSKWAGARSASRSKMRGACPDSGGGLATGEGAHPKRADRCRTARFITEMSVISNREWRANKFRAEGGSLNRLKGKGGNVSRATLSAVPFVPRFNPELPFSRDYRRVTPEGCVSHVSSILKFDVSSYPPRPRGRERPTVGE